MSEREDGLITKVSAPPDDVLRWHRPIKYAADSDAMRQNPGQEREFPPMPTPRAAYNLADNIRRGRLVAFSPAGAFEAVARKTTVWAWYVGEEKT